MIICPSCNVPNQPGSIFCDNCGHDLRDVAAADNVPQQSAAPPPASSPTAGGGPTCPQCGYSNIPGASFCENCGTPLEQSAPAPTVREPYSQQQPIAPPPAAPTGGGTVCPSCGTPNMPGSAFCENCGASLSSAAAPPPSALAPQPVAPPLAPPVTSNGLPCPDCGAINQPGAAFCEFCGVPLGAKPPISQPPLSTYIKGRLVVQNNGANIDIPQGKTEVFVGREDPVSGIFPEIDLDPYGGHDGGVGRKHARLFIQGGQLMIEDLNSVNGTLLNKQKLMPNQPQPVMDGAEIRFGSVITTYHAG